MLDLVGCVAAVETKEQVCMLTREAIGLYLEALPRDERPIAGSKERRTRIAEVVGSNPIRSANLTPNSPPNLPPSSVH